MYLFLAFLLVPLIEIGLFIEVGGSIGTWPTLGLILLTAVVGSAVVRKQGLDTVRRAQKSMATNTLPLNEAFDGMCLVVSGLLLLTPGFFTDAVGLALLVPPIRRWLQGRLATKVKMTVQTSTATNRQGPTDIVDGDYTVVDDDPSLNTPDRR